MKHLSVTTDGDTVMGGRAKKFVTALKAGKTPQEAAKSVGVTIETLRRKGELAKACKELIERADADGLLEAKVRTSLRKARLTELMMQDEDPKTAIAAIRADQTEHGVGGPAVAIQINTVNKDPNIVNALKSLQIEVEGQNGTAGTTDTGITDIEGDGSNPVASVGDVGDDGGGTTGDPS